MDLSQAFEAPIIETIRGADVTFPLLDIDDYLPWIADLTAQRRKKANSLIPANADPAQRFQMAQIAESIEIGLENVSALIWTVPGSKRILTTSLGKAGRTLDEQAAIIKTIPPRRLHGLAADVSGLFERQLRPVTPKPAENKPAATENPDPNSVSPAPDESPAVGETGVGTGS